MSPTLSVRTGYTARDQHGVIVLPIYTENWVERFWYFIRSIVWLPDHAGRL